MCGLLLILITTGGCWETERATSQEPTPVGVLEDPALREASGLARSRRRDDVLWVINDRGAGEDVHAISPRGLRLGEFTLEGSKNRDWEDLASFELEGTPYLLIADIGDNDAKRESRTLYVVEEPDVEKKGAARVAWRIDFRYPDGPRDAESVAVDVQNRRALVLSKRDTPPQIYALPLRPEAEGVVIAEKLGTLESLPPPPPADARPAIKDWRPVGMDISQDGLAAVVLTYSAVYFVERRPGQDWLEALNTEPRRVGVGQLEKAEAVAFCDEARGVLVTGEGQHSPVLFVDFGESSDD